MHYQIRVASEQGVEELIARLSLAAWGAVMAEPERVTAEREGYAAVDRRVRAALAGSLTAFDVCGMMRVCSDAALPALPGGAPPGERILHLNVPDGLDAFVARLASAVLGGPGRSCGQIRLRAALADALRNLAFENPMCGRPGCERAAEPLPLG